MGQPNVSVVIVSYNTREQLRRCLQAVGDGDEAVVVDNASEDGSPEMVREEFPLVRLIENDSNVGFGAANNQGMDLAQGELVLLLNSDAYAAPGAIARLAEEFRNPDVIAAGGRLLNPDGSLQESCANQLTLWAVFCEQTFLERLFPASRLLSPYWTSRRLDVTSPVEQVMGACLMLRPVERFDERFFLYCEDTELCRRLRRHGKILYVPEAEFTHELGASGSDGRWRSVAFYNRGKELYFAINHGRGAALACWLLNRLGALLRFGFWGIASLLTLFLFTPARRRAELFLRVLAAPLRGPRVPPRRAPGLPPSAPRARSGRP
jgi:N-acetylglucosaminyl-diphospho-decaprenol L-rhamnosyltransferase